MKKNRHKLKYSIIAAVLAVIMVFIPLSNYTAFAEGADTALSRQPVVTGESWMSYLPNTTKLSEINLPGTHDSGTSDIMGIPMLKVVGYLAGILEAAKSSAALIPIIGTGVSTAIDIALIAIAAAALISNPGNVSLAPFAQDQSLSIPEQLNAGVRLLDCRLSNFKGATDNTDDLQFSHGGIHCLDENGNYLTIKTVLQNCKDFVKEHPSETVVVGMRHESFFPVPASDENWFLDKIFQLVHKMLNDLFDGVDLDKIAENADPLIDKLIHKELINDPEVIVIDKWEDLPSVGAARGKIIVCEKTDATTEANKVSDYSSNGYDKWNNLQAHFDSAGYQDYAGSTNQLLVSESSCTDSDDVYMSNSAEILALNLSLVDAFIDLFDISSNDARSGGDVQAKIVNPKFKAYNLEKGKYYGWMYMDFVDTELLSHYYNSNVFDFDVAGHQVEYISDVVIAYDKDLSNAKDNLKKAGYQVLEHNFNATGPDKGLDDAIVNGIRNRGSFNMAIGYKTTTNAMDAITGITWIKKPYEGANLDKVTQEMINKYRFELVQTAGTKIQTDKLKGVEGLCDLNIGTAGSLVNLYITKDQTFGERLFGLESVQGYNKVTYDVSNKNREFSQRDIDYSNYLIEYNFNNRHLEMPRDVSGFVLSNNYGRNEINDVFIFYNAAFNDPALSNAYIKPYYGPHAGELYDINNADMSMVPGSSFKQDNIKINYNNDKLLSALRGCSDLSDAQKALIESGMTEARFSLRQKIQPSAEDKALFDKIAKDYTIGQYMEILLTMMSPDEMHAITRLSEAVELSVVIPKEIKKSGKEYLVLREHDGKVEPLKTWIGDDGRLHFMTDRFSTYAIASRDIVPNTSDANSNFILFLILSMAIAALCIGGIIVRKKQHI